MNNLNYYATQAPVVLVEFYATWCPHCQRMAPVVEDIKKSLEGKVPVYQFDIDTNDELATEANVDVIPSFIIYRSGRVFWTHTGEIDRESIMSEIENALR